MKINANNHNSKNTNGDITFAALSHRQCQCAGQVITSVMISVVVSMSYAVNNL